jgi:anti-anti-sigma factor
VALKITTAVKRPGVFVLAPIGTIDAGGNAMFRERISSVLSQNADVIIFDMEFADYINSMGIRELVKARKALKQRGGKIVFTNLQPQIRKVFDILNALPSLKVFASIQELDRYLEAMQNRSPAADDQ